MIHDLCNPWDLDETDENLDDFLPYSGATARGYEGIEETSSSGVLYPGAQILFLLLITHRVEESRGHPQIH